MIRHFILFAKTPNYTYWNIYIYIYYSPLYIQLFIVIGVKHLGDKGIRILCEGLKDTKYLKQLGLRNFTEYIISYAYT